MQRIINIAAEDKLSIATLQRVIRSEVPGATIAQVLPNKRVAGNQPLRASLEKFKKATLAGQHYIVLTDLDDLPCASALLSKWGALNLPDKLLFRVAVREVEAWLLGDRVNLARLLGIKPALVSPYPEQLSDPKSALLALAKKGSRKMQKELLPEAGSLGKTGPGYNDVLCDFVEDHWDYRTAGANAPSLGRFLGRIRQFTTKD